MLASVHDPGQVPEADALRKTGAGQHAQGAESAFSDAHFALTMGQPGTPGDMASHHETFELQTAANVL